MVSATIFLDFLIIVLASNERAPAHLFKPHDHSLVLTSVHICAIDAHKHRELIDAHHRQSEFILHFLDWSSNMFFKHFDKGFSIVMLLRLNQIEQERPHYSIDFPVYLPFHCCPINILFGCTVCPNPSFRAFTEQKNRHVFFRSCQFPDTLADQRWCKSLCDIESEDFCTVSHNIPRGRC
eukprot:Lithocolla_globosa_v1_NODE_1726_length_2377_cov_300.457648.p3 type:complete len:180 gc:universal NODE_1726_length_2377_cov_300.457648:1329-1868(+)